jgi:cytochrome c biogenesis protein CcmG, thiol:disulfide interchange protein DsbE
MSPNVPGSNMPEQRRQTLAPRDAWFLAVMAAVVIGLFAFVVLPYLDPKTPRLVLEEIAKRPLPVLGGDVGSELRLGDLRGKPVLIDFWASWCKPCAAQSLAVSRLADEVGDTARVVGIATSDEQGAAEAYVRAHSPHYTAVFDTDSHIARLLDVRALPTLAVLDESGVIVALERGPLTGPELRRLLERGRKH